MNNLMLALDGAWKVLATSLILGAGLPALFAAGVRSLASRRTAPLGYLCFAVVLIGVGLGITFIVASGFGKELNFDNVYPTVVDKG
ncbi:hypothetical protein [Actinoplanes couchii]|uniref:Uncharacterized protein n=1 Tax=Actinoplanes couchii TaxID=403638 RepID=A0ABQ3X7N1_9ACTN|nr:hypothetical protein [Actinoplanes couchii]MDR6322310.1 hypothetical protein [Actinoplanes couchii]GID54469.1 hypothetical protein Aco03nite_028730 [Actinoplanes couchii]